MPHTRTDLAPFLTTDFDVGKESELMFDLTALLALASGKVKARVHKRPPTAG
jgi:hypothetical protein